MLGFSIVLLATETHVSLVSTPYMILSPHLEGRALRLYAGSSLIHGFALSAVLAIAMALWGAVLSFGFGPPGLGKVILALASMMVFLVFREFARRICFAHLRTGAALAFDISVAVLQTAGLLLLYRLGILSAHLAWWVIGCASGLAGAGWFFLNRKRFLARPSRAATDFARNWKSGRWIFGSTFLWTLSMHLYPWLLTCFHGTASAGVWAACTGVVAFINVPFVGMQNLLGPRIAAAYAEGGKDALCRLAFTSSLTLLIVLGVPGLTLFLAGDPLLVMLYGPAYGGGGLTASVLAMGLVTTAAAFPFSRALLAMERADLDFRINCIPLLILLTFGLLLSRAFGPLGAAVGLALANLLSSGARYLSFALILRPSKGEAS